MAVFYKHVKGTTNTDTNKAGLWTWLKWSRTDDKDITTLDAKFLPHIHINSKNEDPNTSNDLGYIITSKATQQKIKSVIEIPNIETTTIRGSQEKSKNLTLVAQNIRITEDDYQQNDCVRIKSQSAQYTATWPEETTNIWDGPATFNGDVNINTHLIVQSSIANEGYVQAVYFNATSDKRAKENIHPLLTNALDIIKKVQVYTFNLKSQPEEKMVGVIAQEFLDKKLDGVSLVANETATGKDGDYMSIRESKLVYLLLKGMQEQQEQIEQLQKRITELESK